MAKLFKPRLFSQQFSINPAALQKAGLLDPFLNADTKLFIDPLLLRHSRRNVVSFAKLLGKFFQDRHDRVCRQIADSVGSNLLLKNAHQPNDFRVCHPQIYDFSGCCEDFGFQADRPAAARGPPAAVAEARLAPLMKIIIGTVEFNLPENPLDPGHAFALVPKDVLRELPVASDWSDIAQSDWRNVAGVAGSHPEPNKRAIAGEAV